MARTLVLGIGISLTPSLTGFDFKLPDNFSETIEIISELTPKDFHPLSSTKRFLVFLTDLSIVPLSNGLIDLRSIISEEMPLIFNTLLILIN